ncbi:MAG: hypothetical protein G01um101438_752 [Parcubacteria group bacterium Gr01-1014_38]|nr:MAG: hypothetical protein G01um101438_752 [Parcubacteria group bacterium Gr01-1014_38]
MTSLNAADRETRGFQLFLEAVLESFPEEWELPHRIVRHLLRQESSTHLDELAELAKNAFPGEGADVPLEGWRRIALHAVASLQRVALKLFAHERNPEGYFLHLADNDAVSSMANPALCAELCSQQAT